jgi:hypothetical protein
LTVGWRAPVLTALLGVPVHAEDRRAYVEALTRYLDGPKAAAAYCVTALDRLMNKAVGLMGADSIFAAIAVYLSERPGLGGWGAAALVLLVLAVGLLCTTLWATSSGIQPHRMTEAAVLEHGMRLVMGRTMRFTLALWLSGLGYVFLFIQVIAGFVLS